MNKVILSVVSILSLTACTDTGRASLSAYGNPATVTCYSGGTVIFKGRSTGRVQSTEQSDGWEFKDAGTGKFTRISGTCVVIHD